MELIIKIVLVGTESLCHVLRVIKGIFDHLMRKIYLLLTL